MYSCARPCITFLLSLLSLHNLKTLNKPPRTHFVIDIISRMHFKADLEFMSFLGIFKTASVTRHVFVTHIFRNAFYIKTDFFQKQFKTFPFSYLIHILPRKMRSLTTFLYIIVVAMAITSQSTMANKYGDTQITIFADANFAGTAAAISVRERGCTSVPTNLNDQITSISFNSTNRVPNCLFAFTDFLCAGTRFLFTDATVCLNNLGTPPCNADNTISSFKSCEVIDFIGLRGRGRGRP